MSVVSRIGLLMAIVLAVSSPSLAKETFEEARARFETDMETYSSFRRRSDGWTRFAATRDPRAIPILAEQYRSPRTPEEQSRYLLVDVAGRNFREPRHVDTWLAWTKAHRGDGDSWLRYHAFRVRAKHRGPEGARTAALGSGSAFLRAAALEALADADPSAAAVTAATLLEDLPRTGYRRHVLVAAIAWTALAGRGQTEDPHVRRLYELMIEHAEDKRTPDDDRLLVVRHLARALGLDRVPTNTIYLRDALSGAAKSTASGDRYGRPRFMGLEASGKRICYVIDMSDSMCRLLGDKEREDLRGPVTPGESDRPQPPPVDPALPWDKIKTRFDAARECLKQSVLGLTKDHSFAVIIFGTEARMLSHCDGMRPWSKTYARKVCDALDWIRLRPVDGEDIRGCLRGDTNLHGGLQRAFRLTAKGLVPGNEYVDRQALLTGCDTIFLLTDGQPTADDWRGSDPGMTTGGTYDPESGKRTGGGTAYHADNVAYRGPYSYGGGILSRDVHRMNMFRRAEILCVGIGEANVGLLRDIAEIGMGRVRIVGGRSDR